MCLFAVLRFSCGHTTLNFVRCTTPRVCTRGEEARYSTESRCLECWEGQWTAHSAALSTTQTVSEAALTERTGAKWVIKTAAAHARAECARRLGRPPPAEQEQKQKQVWRPGRGKEAQKEAQKERAGMMMMIAEGGGGGGGGIGPWVCWRASGGRVFAGCAKVDEEKEEREDEEEEMTVVGSGEGMSPIINSPEAGSSEDGGWDSDTTVCGDEERPGFEEYPVPGVEEADLDEPLGVPFEEMMDEIVHGAPGEVVEEVPGQNPEEERLGEGVGDGPLENQSHFEDCLEEVFRARLFNWVARERLYGRL
ncbi:predicted protein [Chaetomium globosum CBS 148.51]|uniref:Uncharacterized protein n=1 Tax=Chaetomium globosum (strain ATCC 6205 / CBS 148.51 / DSM 1962 / NBRC 6347 / NRRL 1970) TaxID=306901 RepID=Q2HAT3_CHAGB|nr:uncharacterized protein CHGG_02671 [Chaetomium globosum CBS 148.51]EAQ90736.1 predicted protein [Chaetomium globosum CBS 148.51]